MISCILVIYHPELDKLKFVVASIKDQVNTVYIIDNGEKNLDPNILDAKNIRYIPLGSNKGIAKAQNIGIREAMKLKHDYILLSDQDTVYPEAYVKQMLQTFNELSGKICSVAPAYFDTNKGAVQHFIDHQPFTHYFKPTPGVNRVSHAIASGMIIPTAVLDVVGLMQEDLFIDWVDLEWCWRAKYRFGYQNLGVGHIIIQHTMGDEFIRFFNRKVSFRAPVRHYYMIRNAIHLAMHSNSAGPAIRFEIFIKAFLWTFIFPAIAPNKKREHFLATMSGFFDGLRNRLGPRPR